MGRAKIDTDSKLPENKINSTFNKRKQGAFNKAKQLGKLCDCDVALIVFNPKGEGVTAVSHGMSVDNIYQRFRNFRVHYPDKTQISEVMRPPQQQQQHHQDNANAQPQNQLPWMQQNATYGLNFHQDQANQGPVVGNSGPFLIPGLHRNPGHQDIENVSWANSNNGHQMQGSLNPLHQSVLSPYENFQASTSAPINNENGQTY